MLQLCSEMRACLLQLLPELVAHFPRVHQPGQLLRMAEAFHQGRDLLEGLQLLAIPKP